MTPEQVPAFGLCLEQKQGPRTCHPQGILKKKINVFLWIMEAFFICY